MIGCRVIRVLKGCDSAMAKWLLLCFGAKTEVPVANFLFGVPSYVCVCFVCTCAGLPQSETAWISGDVQFVLPVWNDSPKEFSL